MTARFMRGMPRAAAHLATHAAYFEPLKETA